MHCDDEYHRVTLLAIVEDLVNAIKNEEKKINN